MARRDFDRWCHRASGYIYYPPDREEVSQELYWHYDDSVEALMEEGMDKESAQSAALEAMGDAKAVGKLLRTVHKPWLGIIYSALQILLGLCVIAAIVVVCLTQFHRTRNEIGYLFRDIPRGAELVYDHSNSYIIYGCNGSTDCEVTVLSPSGEVKCGEYSFQVSEATLAYYPALEEERLSLLLSYSSPRFWLGEPEAMWGSLRTMESTGTEHRINDYDAEDEGEGIAEDLIMQRNGYTTDNGMGLHSYYSLTATGEYIIEFPVSPEAQWVDLICDKGEGFDIRIYLRKGGSQ